MNKQIQVHEREIYEDEKRENQGSELQTSSPLDVQLMNLELNANQTSMRSNDDQTSYEVKKFISDPDTNLLNETISPILRRPDYDRANKTSRDLKKMGQFDGTGSGVSPKFKARSKLLKPVQFKKEEYNIESQESLISSDKEYISKKGVPAAADSPTQVAKVLHKKSPKLITQKSSSKLVKYHSRLSPKLKHKKSKLSNKRQEQKDDEDRMRKIGSDLRMVESPLYKTKEIHLFNTEFA